MWIGVLCLIASVWCYSISQLQQHGKLRFNINNKRFSFWGEDSDKRKYKAQQNERLIFIPAPSNWYYRLIRSDYKERWFTSTWLTVNLTDGYHMMQSLSFIFLAISLARFSGINFFWFWPAIPAGHALFYRIFQR